MNNYTLTVSSRDAVNATDTAYNYEVNVPFIPPGQFKCTVSYIAATLTAATPYVLQMRAPEITRALSSGANDGWMSVCILNGAEVAAPGVFYLSQPPKRLQVRMMIQTSNGLASALGHTQVLIHMERIDI